MMMSDKNETALRAALEQAESQDDPDAVRQAEKHLTAAGFKRAARKRQAAAKDDDEVKDRAPAGRAAESPRKQTTAKPQE